MRYSSRTTSNRWFEKFPFIGKLALLFIGLFIVFFQPSVVEAHSSLEEMEPAENGIIDESPSELMLRFNEPVEHNLATVTVYDANANPVFTGNPDNDVEKSQKLTFSLPELDDGTYTVQWDIVSADGHPVGGTYAFSVGKATESGAQTIDEGGTDSGLIISRVISEMVLLVGAGLFWFAWLAERRHFPGIDALWKKRRYIVGILLVIGTIAEFITYSLSLPSGIIQVILNGRWELLLQFPFILMLFAQLFFLILLFIPGMMRGWYLALWLILAIVPAFGGHVWSMENPIIALIPRIFHQLAIALWLGALCYMILLVIRQKRTQTSIDWKAFRPFFVYKMLVASGVVVISGVVMVYLQTGITAIFTNWKTWSGVVIAKIILTIVMGGFALYQTLKWREKRMFTTGRLVRSEWLIGLIILVLGVWMSQIAYPIDTESYDETLTNHQIDADVNIDSLHIGEPMMSADIPEVNGEVPEKVEAKVIMPQHDMESDDLEAKENGNGNYTVELPLSMSGTWQLEITATYPGHKTVKWEDEIYVAGEEN